VSDQTVDENTEQIPEVDPVQDLGPLGDELAEEQFERHPALEPPPDEEKKPTGEIIATAGEPSLFPMYFFVVFFGMIAAGFTTTTVILSFQVGGTVGVVVNLLGAIFSSIAALVALEGINRRREGPNK